MYILTIRTDKPEAELGLYNDTAEQEYYVWEAHRSLAETIHKKILSLLEQSGIRLNQLGGIAVFKGPGSFTGLRIGITVANALAASNQIPIVGADSKVWKDIAVKSLLAGNNDRLVIPEYGSLPNITAPRK